MKDVIDINNVANKGKQEIDQREIAYRAHLCETLDWLKENINGSTSRIPLFAILHITFADKLGGKRSMLDASSVELNQTQSTTLEEVSGALSLMKNKLFNSEIKSGDW